MANTTHYNLPYPSDYTAIADVPEAVKQLAEGTDTTIYTIMGNLETILHTLNVRKWGGIDECRNRSNIYDTKHKR